MSSGIVDTASYLQNILNAKNNDAYLVSDENCIYGYTEEDGWINLGTIFNITVIENDIVQRVNANTDSKLETHIKSTTITKRNSYKQ